MKNPLLEVKNLHTYFFTNKGTIKAVQGVDFTIEAGKTLGIVGESGSGKSITAFSILNLLEYPGKIVQGEINFGGINLVNLGKKDIRKIRGNDISMIFQEPMTSLNPVHRIGRQLSEPLILHQHMSKKEAWAAAIDLLREVKIPNPENVVYNYPFQLSGGMRQRVMIAMALACEPKLLIADEPTTALDVTIQAQILDLMQDLKKKLGMGIIMITHDLGVVASMCDQIAVMYAGEIVEYGATDDIFYNPKHEYTKGLLKSIPKFQEKDYSKLVPIEGHPVDLLNPPKGCGFAPRCEKCMQICLTKKPVRSDYESLCGKDHVHYSRCWLEQKAEFESAQKNQKKENENE